MKNRKIIVAAIIAAIAAFVAVYLIPSPGKKAPSQKAKVVKVSKKGKHFARQHRKAGESARKINSQGKDGERVLLEADEEAKLTAAERALLEELRDGADDDNFHRVAKAVKQIQALQREKGQDAVPVLLRQEAVEALGEFLPGSLPELMGFMADTNPEVFEDVMSQFEDAIDNSGLGDRALADIITTVARVVKSEDALDALFMCIENDMRNSVAVSTYIEISKTGSEEAKARLQESIEDFTGEDDMTDIKKLEDWAKENPDDEDDDEFYGPDDDDDDKDGE